MNQGASRAKCPAAGPRVDRVVRPRLVDGAWACEEARASGGSGQRAASAGAALATKKTATSFSGLPAAQRADPERGITASHGEQRSANRHDALDDGQCRKEGWRAEQAESQRQRQRQDQRLFRSEREQRASEWRQSDCAFSPTPADGAVLGMACACRAAASNLWVKTQRWA